MIAEGKQGHWHIPWLFDLPAHWQVVSSKQLFWPRKELAREHDQQLSATQAYGVINQREFERRIGRKVVQITQNLEKRRHVERDDFVISMRSFQGGLERAWETGCIRSSYVVLKPSDRVDVNFFQYVFKAHPYIEALRATSNFIRDGQDLNISNFSLVDLPLPPKDEQRLLARYLNWHGTRTAKLVRTKKRLIGLLNEEKRAIIHRAVTRGLDPSPKLKPSGISWLGDIPEDWAIRKIRHCGRIVGGMTPSMDNSGYWNGDIPWVSPKDMKRDQIADSIMHVTEAAVSDTSLRLIEADAVLMVVRGMILARRIPVARAMVPITINQDMKAIIPNKSVNPDFLCHILSSFQSALASLIDESGHGTRRFPTERWREMAFAFPSLTEQRAICDWIDRASIRQNQSIGLAEREITLIQEFRTRLIADVVTGKLDVRAVAAGLPEVTDAGRIEEPNEGDDLDLINEADEDGEVAA